MSTRIAPRYELFFKDVKCLETELRALRRRTSSATTRVNVPNKDKKDDLIAWIDAARTLSDDVDVVPHYSMKNQYRRDANQSVEAVKAFADAMTARNIDRCLLVSGSGSRKCDSVEVLRRLAMDREWKRRASAFRFDVAYNPHFDEGSDAAAREFERLEKKMRGGLVRGVWFQIGSDVEKLERALERVRDLAPDAEIYGSVFLPSKQLLARMKFRPWAGVFLSDEYLSSVERAEEITIAQMACLVRHGATPLIESPVTKDEDWAQCERLLAAAAKRVDESGKL